MKKITINPLQPELFSFTFNGNRNDISLTDILTYYSASIAQFAFFSSRPYCWLVSDFIDGIIADAGGALEQLCNITKEDAVGNNPDCWLRNIHPSDLPSALAFSNHTINQYRTTSAEMRKYLRPVIYTRQLNNEQIYYNSMLQFVNVLTDKKGNPCFSLIIISDISNIKKDDIGFMSIYNSYNQSITNLFCRDGKDLTRKLEKTPAVSKREIEIIRLLSAGNSSKEISCLLYLSVRTVQNHRYNILKKLNVRTTAELIAFANKMKLI